MKPLYRFRSAVTGRFVTARCALWRAATTVREKVKRLVRSVKKEGSGDAN